MSTDPKLIPSTPQEIASRWLSRFEKCIRKRDYVNSEEMIHKQCVGFGLDKYRLVNREQWKEEWRLTWPHQLAFTFDHASANLIFEHGLILISLPWVAQSTIQGAPSKGGRATIGLMMFEGEKVLAVHFHWSRNVE